MHIEANDPSYGVVPVRDFITVCVPLDLVPVHVHVAWDSSGGGVHEDFLLYAHGLVHKFVNDPHLLAVIDVIPTPLASG